MDPMIALQEAHRGGESAAESLHKLRSAVAALSSALDETLDLLQGTRRAGPPEPEPVSPRSGLAPWQVRRVLAHIDANLDQPIRNQDLATIARLSAFHFCVAFRNSVGHSPHEFIIRRRVERAQGVMLSTAKSLSEIAVECGLADQAHLTRLFRKVVGESPAAWRKARANPA